MFECYKCGSMMSTEDIKCANCGAWGVAEEPSLIGDFVRGYVQGTVGCIVIGIVLVLILLAC